MAEDDKTQQFLKNFAFTLIASVVGGILLGLLENSKSGSMELHGLSIKDKDSSIPKNTESYLSNKSELYKDKQLGLWDYFTKPEGIKELQSLRKYG